MNPSADTELLFLLLRSGLHTETPDDTERLRTLCAEHGPDWPLLYRLSARQGMLAIAWDGVERLVREEAIPPEHQPSRTQKIRWAVNVERIEQTYARQWAAACELAERYAAAGIRTVVLKGFAAAVRYPVPEHRPCGDPDCFLPGAYEAGNRLAEQFGARVERDFYKHSHIVYKGLMVENHHFCTAIRGSRKAKRLERALQENLAQMPPTPLNGSHLKLPSPLFNALFLTVHGWGHFLNEGITLRQLCDWAMLLRTDGEAIDWARFRELISGRDRGMYAFAESTLRLAHAIFGTPIPDGTAPGKGLREADRRLLRDTLFDRNPVYNTEGSDWQKRFKMVRNMLNDRWKYRCFSETSSLGQLLRTGLAYLLERNPHL